MQDRSGYTLSAAVSPLDLVRSSALDVSPLMSERITDPGGTSRQVVPKGDIPFYLPKRLSSFDRAFRNSASARLPAKLAAISD